MTRSLSLAYTVIFVPDVAAAVDFYERAFGLSRRMVTPAFAQMETGAVALAFGAESNERKELPAGFEFHENRPEGTAAGIQISFTCEAVQAAWDHAVSEGATPVVAPQRMPWGQTVSRVRDLNGVLVSLVSPFRPQA